MKVRLDGDWEKLAGTVWDGKKEGTIELALYQTERLTRLQIFCWLPDTAYESNFVFPTTDWQQALSTFNRLDEGEETMGELLTLALVEAFGATEATKLLHDLDEATPTSDSPE